MRAIYGKPDNPSSAHILIIRGVDAYSIDYFTEHVKKYPTWGLILTWDGDEYFAEAMIKTLPQTSIHQFVSNLFSCDEDLIRYVLSRFPKYNEESDPTTESYIPPPISCMRSEPRFPLLLRGRQKISIMMLRAMGCTSIPTRVEDIPENILRDLKREMIEKLLEPEYNHLFNFEIEKDLSPDIITINSSMVVGRKETPTIESGPLYGPTY